MTWSRRLAVWGLLPALSGWSFAARAEVVGLQKLEQQALASGALADGNTARIRGAEAETRKAASAYYPQVGLKAESTVQPGRALVQVTDDRGDEYLVQGSRSIDDGKSAYSGQLRHGLELSVTSSLYNFGRTAAAVAAGRAGYEVAVAAGEAQRAQVVSAVRAQYLSWLAAHELLRISQESQSDAERRSARASALIAQGTKSESELTPMRAEELLARLESARARNDLARAKTELERVVGKPLPADAEPDLALLQTEPLAPATASKEDRDLRLLERQYAAARALAHAQEIQRRPELATGLTAGVRAQNADGLKVFPLYGAGLTLSVPLWDGGVTAASAEAARAQASALRAQMRDHERDHDTNRKLSELDAASALERLALSEQLRALSEQRLSELEAGYALGAASIEQIGQARTMLRRARTEELMAKIAHAEARLRAMPLTTAQTP